MHLSTDTTATSPFALGGRSAVPVTAPATGRVGLDAAAITRRIDAVLAGTGAGLHFDRVLMYTLDDKAQRLEIAGQWTAYETELVETARPLALATADVTAMAGSAVVLEDETAVSEWPVPVWCAACVCVPVSSATMIFGTLWLTCRDNRAFSDAELGLIEIIAGRLAMELEMHASLTTSIAKPHAAHTTRPAVKATVKSARDNKPPVVPLPQVPALEELELAGWALDRAATGSFYDWQCLQDGRLLVIAASVTSGISNGDDALWLQAARIALRSHARQCQDAGELVTYVNNTLWTASPGGQGLSLAVALVDSIDGTGTLALAGNAMALRWRASTCEAITTESSPAGWHQRAAFLPRECSLHIRERLVLSTSGARHVRIDRLCDELLANSSEAQRRMHARGALGMVLEASSDRGCDLRSAALIRRR